MPLCHCNGAHYALRKKTPWRGFQAELPKAAVRGWNQNQINFDNNYKSLKTMLIHWNESVCYMISFSLIFTNFEEKKEGSKKQEEEGEGKARGEEEVRLREEERRLFGHGYRIHIYNYLFSVRCSFMQISPKSKIKLILCCCPTFLQMSRYQQREWC